MPDDPTPTAAEMQDFAVRAYADRDYLPVAAHASLATLTILRELVSTLARDSVATEWSRVHLPSGGVFTCSCGSQAFKLYPTPDDRPYVVCAIDRCPAVWDLTEPERVPQRVDQPGAPTPWQVNRLVRHRHAYPTPIGEMDCDIFALLQRPSESRPGWWEATVIETDPLTGIRVGQGVTLHERGGNNVMARFPD